MSRYDLIVTLEDSRAKLRTWRLKLTEGAEYHRLKNPEAAEDAIAEAEIAKLKAAEDAVVEAMEALHASLKVNAGSLTPRGL